MRVQRFSLFIALGVLALLRPSPSHSEILDGPVKAQVVRVIDGDTFVANAFIWPGQTIRVNVRIRGIDTAELRAACPAEHRLAEKARSALAGLIANQVVSISRIGGGKYYGRVLANVETQEGTDIAASMLGSALARPYGPKSRHWACGM
jgi:micrococcal nuclease